MLEITPTSGSIETTESHKKRLAKESKKFNIENQQFCDLFPDLATEIKEILTKEKAQEAELNLVAEKNKKINESQLNVSNQDYNWKSTILGNFFNSLLNFEA